MSNLLIKAGHLLDPAMGLDATLDLLVKEGKIAAIGENLPVDPAVQIIDAEGLLVTAGLIDLHAHVYGGGTAQEAEALCGLGAGVTSVVDAGSAGAPDFEDFNETIISQCQTSVFSFLYNHWWPSGYEPESDLHENTQIDVEAIVDLAEQHREIVKGVKIAVMPPITRKFGLDPVFKGHEAARKAGIRLMLHIGDIGAPHLPETPERITNQALELLEEGDTLTHVFSPLTGGGLTADDQVLPALEAAQRRGVVMDAAIGDYQFSWQAAEKVLQAGIRPTVISSDAEVNANLPKRTGVLVHDRRARGERVASDMTLVEYMAYFFELGFSLSEIITMTTSAPAVAAGIADRAGSLEMGRPADISLLRLIEGDFALRDVTGEIRRGRKAFEPVGTVKAGHYREAGPAPHPWGFAPPRAV